MGLDRPIYKLGKIVRDQTVPYRKGEVVKTEEHGSLAVTTIDAFPPAPERGELVDMHFIQVGFTEAAADKDGFVAALKEAVEDGGEFTDLPWDVLNGGPSYISIGGWIGDQTLALRFMALCKFHGLGDVITPELLGFDGEAADQMAGGGMIFCPIRTPA